MPGRCCRTGHGVAIRDWPRGAPRRRHARNGDFPVGEKAPDHPAQGVAVQGPAAQGRFEVEERPGREGQKIPGDINVFQDLLGQIDDQREADQAERRLVCGLDHFGFFIGRANEIDPFLGLEVREALVKQLLFLLGQTAGHQGDAQVLFEGLDQGLLDHGRVRHVAQFPGETGDALLDRIDLLGLELLDRNTQTFEHGCPWPARR